MSEIETKRYNERVQKVMALTEEEKWKRNGREKRKRTGKNWCEKDMRKGTH